MAKLLSGVHVRDMNLHDRRGERADTIEQGNAGVGVSTCVEHDTIVRKAHFLQLVDEFTLDVALVIINLRLCKIVAQLL